MYLVPDCAWARVGCLNAPAPRLSREHEDERDGVQGNQGGNVNKWLIAFIMVMETDSVRDRKRNMETKHDWDTLMRERKKETVNRSCSVWSPLERNEEETRCIK